MQSDDPVYSTTPILDNPKPSLWVVDLLDVSATGVSTLRTRWITKTPRLSHRVKEGKGIWHQGHGRWLDTFFNHESTVTFTNEAIRRYMFIARL
jgi:hypothetical protein